ncbi:MAG: lipocalin family protein [Chloroflexota bacterium]
MKSSTSRNLIVAGAAAGAAACAVAYYVRRKRTPPPKTAPYVDIERYLGKWYELARTPNWFQRNCICSTAEYSLREDGRIGVLNSCRKGSPTGKIKQVKGWAEVADEETNSKLKVKLKMPFKADYWILDVAEDYSWAIVGDPCRKRLWILSRVKDLEEEKLDGLIETAALKGYDVSHIIRSIQSCEDY